MAFEHFSELSPQDVSYEPVAERYEAIFSSLESASSGAEVIGVIKQWDAIRRELTTWSSLTRLRFQQQTANEERRAANEVCDGLVPRFVDLDVKMKREMLASPFRQELVEAFGDHLFNLWDCDVASFAPEIQADMVAESKLKNEYMALRAGAKIPFRGQDYTLAGIGKFGLDTDRQTRHEAAAATWAWYDENAQALDRIYGELVQLRHKMAVSLGYEDFVALGYKHMQRVDYDRGDVALFRAQVRDHLVPLVTRLRKEQGEALGLDPLAYWDENMPSDGDPPVPKGDTPWLVEQARGFFEALGDKPSAFYQELTRKGLLDLDARENKASGAFCTAFPDSGNPFIFGNFNGTLDDVRTFVHELGHAFQFWTSRTQEPSDYMWPTYEACEIHSMGLEFIALPFMDRFFGEDAERFCRQHIIKALMFIPYGVAVDHFQHMVYERPDATAVERHQMWQECERTYLPHRDYGDLGRLAAGGLWQRQLHIYMAPFYYIDYTLAQTCALQLYLRSKDDFDGTVADYVALCHRGGEAPFQDLARSAGLKSPLEEGCLKSVVERLSGELG